MFSKKSLKFKLLELFATWFYSGKSPKAPGTCGSLATLPFVYVIFYFGGYWALICFILLICLIGIYVADAFSKALNIKDPGQIVIDETAGQSIALIFAGTNLWLYLLGFALFRLFDISKPSIIGWADKKIKGGLGIMLDDIFAGLFAAAIIALVRYFLL